MLLYLFIILGAVCALGLAMSLTNLKLPHWNNQGAFVAEAWLEWPVCRGSTLYRQRFRTEWMAALYAKYHAMLLDFELPRTYAAEMSDGRRYLEAYEFGVYFGVRRVSSHELEHGVADIWSPTMPGSRDAVSEHREAHPLWRQDAEKQAVELGYKV